MTNIISQIKDRLFQIASGFIALVIICQFSFLAGAAIASPLSDSQASSSQTPNSGMIVAGFFNNNEKKVEDATAKAKEVSNKLGNRAKQELTKTGIAIDQKGNEIVNKTKGNMDKLQNKVEDSKQNIGDKAANAVEDTKNNIGDAANDAMENVKELFDKK
jgi:ElaB/YqjD/DUF883 family membrane-anchored ribosome-binding protein